MAIPKLQWKWQMEPKIMECDEVQKMHDF